MFPIRLGIIILASLLCSVAFIPSTPCHRLVSSLGSNVVKTSGEEYELAASGAWNLANAVLRPACVVLPTQSSHVVTAMKEIYRSKTRYAVQAGGHSAMEGWNNVGDGILISFSRMNKTQYHPKTRTVTLQPGIRWGNVYAQLEPLGVAPVGARVGDVGAGLLLGGGLSFLSPVHGFAADTIEELDVVLANGTLVTARARGRYSDLFKALKGGGNRFGIVTRYEMLTFRTGTKADKTWYGGTIIYPASSAKAVMIAVARYVRDVKDPRAALLVYFLDTNVEGVITSVVIANVYYHGEVLPPTIYGTLLSIPSISQNLTSLSYYEVTSSLGTGEERGSTSLFGAAAFGSDEEQYLNALEHFRNFTRNIPPEVLGSAIAFTPVLQTQITAGRRRGGNAINPPDGGYSAVQFTSVLRPGIVNTPPALDAARSLWFEQNPSSPRLPLFLNECDRQQKVLESYGDFAFLKRTYGKYDPTRFNVLHTDGPSGL